MGPRKNRIDTGCDCDVCDRPNYAKTWMVECMGCRKWLHYDCANVTPGVKHRTFYCLKCTGGNTTPTNSRNTGARKKQADPVLPPVTDGDAESALVDENAKDPAEQVLSSKNSNKSSRESNNIRLDTNSKPSASRPKQNNYVAVSSKPISVASKSERSSVKVAGSVRERLALLEAKQDLARMRLDEEEKRRKEDSDARLKRLSMEEDFLREKLEIIDRAESVLESEWSRTHKVRKWLDKQKKDGPELEEEDNAVGGRKPEGNSSPVRHPEVMVARSCSSANRHNRHSTRLSDCSSRTAAQERRVSTRLPQRSSHIENSWKGPTAEQIAARNIWPKKLPTFSGDPETWPLFINTYENGNTACGFSNTENLIRLQESLQGNARAVVQMKLMEPKCVPSIIEVLKQLFGRPELLIKALLANLRKVSAPHPENLESLLSFGVAVTQVCDYLETAKLDAHLSNPTILAELVAKLPSSYQMEWVRYKRACNECTLKEFGEFMQLLIFDASEVTTITSGKLKPIMFDKIQSSKGHFHTHMESEVEVKPKGARIPCVSCARTDHRLQNCDVFKRLSVPERKKLIEKEKLCSLCFFGHTSECNSKRRCGVNQCSERHHPLLHPERLAGEESREQRQTGGRRDNGGPSYVTANCNVHRPAKRAILFHVVPVTLHNGENQIDVLAFLDDGSSLSLLEADVASKIGIQGIHQPLEMTWTSNVTRSETASQNVRIQISPRGSNTKIQMWNVHTVNRLNLPSQSMNTSIMCSRFKHLKGLPVDSYAAEEPKLLIGLDHADLLYPIESRKGLPGEPIAVRSALGWSVFGPVGDELPVAEYCNVHRCACENLDERLRQFYAIEEAGIDIGNQPEKDADRRAREILEATTTRIGKRFETGLLWRTSDVKFPSSSYAMAEKRLRSLEHRLAKSEELRDNVHSQINQYIQKGYAHIASEEELTKTSPEKTWYLPVNIVLNPKKPNKVRLVWDAAAKVEGVSLNSLLLKGPDLLTALPTVLSRFRERNIGFGGDIAEMFHQVRIRNDDKHAQRFLFRPNPLAKPIVYVMDVATFGAACSPCSAQFIKNKNAEEFTERFPEASEAIVNKTYVDDYFDSTDSVAEAIERAQQVRWIHQEGGFHIRNWVSNSTAFLEAMGSSSAESLVKVGEDKNNSVDRVLGMYWQAETDVFLFSTSTREDLGPFLFQGQRPTKRMALRCLMSLFDPLGLLSPLLVHGKILLQDVWRSGITWDEELKEPEFLQWLKWTSLFSCLQDLSVPRCYFENCDPAAYESLQLHVFADASEHAYGCVAYFRIVDAGQPKCALVMSKSRVAPLKPLSIPRMELQAAVAGARMTNAVRSNHSLPIRESFLWIDNKVVLSWLASDPRNYTPFVGNRVAEIHDLIDVRTCRWVPTKDNVADILTKWTGEAELKSCSRWYHGPQFLLDCESSWPESALPSPGTQEELRAKFLFHDVTTTAALIDPSRISRWKIIVRTVTMVYRFIENCRRRLAKKPIVAVPRGNMRALLQFPATITQVQQKEYQRAEFRLWQMAQQQEFPDEYSILVFNRDKPVNKWKPLEKCSFLYNKSPFIDEFGVMRMESRIEHAVDLPFDLRFPVILPRKNLVTTRLLEYFHRQFGHSNRETVVNEVRQRFVIQNLRAAIKDVMKACQWCKIRKCKPDHPKMAPLPKERLTPHIRPFSYVGIDYCGPIEVTVTRHKEKRYIAVFTCLVTRGVHLEVAHSLSTDSCKMAIRRFVKRKAAPVKIFSDNGTNLVGASRELAEQLRRINEACSETFTDARTEWCFNPPSAPHMGGVWERMVRSVKESLKAYDDGGKLNDEILLTSLPE